VAAAPLHPDDLTKVHRFLTWFLDREGTGRLEAHEGQVIFDVSGTPGLSGHLEDGDWCVYDIRHYVGKRFKIVDKYSFGNQYEEVE
jgi:hypothetical protein